MCLGVVLFGSNLFEILCASWTCMSISFTQLVKFSLILFSNKFSISCSCSSPSGTPMIQVLVCLRDIPEAPYTILIFLNSFFFLLLWLNAYFFLMFQIIDLNPSSFPSLLVPCGFFFISLSRACISSLMLSPYSVSSLSILITSVLNSASDSWLSPFCLVLFLGFCSVLSFGPYFFASSIWLPLCVCFSVLHRAALTPCLSRVGLL